MGTCRKSRDYPLEHHLKARVITSILAAVKNPLTSVQDETLTAVILVAYGEYLMDRRYGSQSSFTVHQGGAEALIRKRGVLNFRTSMSLALFDAVRHNAVNLSFYHTSNTKNWDLWNLDGDVGKLCDSYTPATELDACAVGLVNVETQLESIASDEGGALRGNLSTLQERLQSWPHRVPSEWLPQRTASGEIRYPSPEICYVFNQWHLLQLAMSHVTRSLEMKTNLPQIRCVHSSCEMELINNIIYSEASGLGSKCNTMGPAQTVHVNEDFPCATPQQCHLSPLGSRLFGQTLDRLDQILSNAVNSLFLPSQVALRYHEVLSWARRERDTIRHAFPLAGI